MKTRQLHYSFLILFFLLITPKTKAQETAITSKIGTFKTIEKQYSDSRIDGYNIYLPPSYNKENGDFPVLIFLQGGLGVGGEVAKIYNWALPKMLKDAETLDSELRTLVSNTFIVLMSHISGGQFYDNTAAIKTILKEVEDAYRVDKNRIYLTGLSRGGHGTWGLADRMPEYFAAIAPICGGNSGITDAGKLKDLPMWITHNTGDRVVNYNNTQRTVTALENLKLNFHKTNTIAEADYKNSDRILTSGENDSHDAWTEMYNNPNFYRWLLKYSKE